jgi:hypothetical protein
LVCLQLTKWAFQMRKGVKGKVGSKPTSGIYFLTGMAKWKKIPK